MTLRNSVLKAAQQFALRKSYISNAAVAAKVLDLLPAIADRHRDVFDPFPSNEPVEQLLCYDALDTP